MPTPPPSEPTDQAFEFDAEFIADPYPGYARLRAAGPVHRVVLPEGNPAWLVTRYADVRALLADPRLSLNKKNSAGGGFKGFALPPALDANLLNFDPPDHTRLRRLVSTAFTPRRVAGLRPRVEAIAAELLDAVDPTRPVDLVEAFAAPLPALVISELLGVPKADTQNFRGWTNALLTPDPGEPSQVKAAIGAMLQYLVGLVASKRAEPADDLLSAMIAARDEQDRLSEDELISLVFLILLAGYETSVTLIGNGVLALLRDPELLARVRGDAALLAPAIEELLRYDGPTAIAIRRFPLQDLDIDGVTIPAGETVLLSIAAANRDPERFADPDSLDLGRAENPHLGFGHGIHYCLGAPLARLEGEVAIGALLRRFPALALAVPPEQLRWRPTIRSHSLRALPVTVPPVPGECDTRPL